MIDQNFGPFDIKRELGKGGFSTVYEAYDREQNRPVALKMFDTNAILNNTLQHRFLREIEVSRRLRHRNIVKVYRAGFYNNQGYISLRLMKGGTLTELHRSQKPLEPLRVARAIRHIATALDYAHGQNVLHRDVKPSNVLMHENGVACLADFGLTKVQGMATVTNLNDVIGSTHYMAPEQVQGLRYMTELSDIYSLGVILYELVTGRVPFNDKSQARILQSILSDPPPPPQKVNPSIGNAVARVLDKALKKEAEARFQKPLELSNAFYEALERDGVISRPAPSAARGGFSAVNPDHNPLADSDFRAVSPIPAGSSKSEEAERPKSVTSQTGFWIALGILVLAIILLLIFVPNLM